MPGKSQNTLVERACLGWPWLGVTLFARHVGGVCWHWAQRKMIAKSSCPGSKHGEVSRRADLDNQLPIARNGHAPQLHERYKALASGRYGWRVSGERVRGF